MKSKSERIKVLVNQHQQLEKNLSLAEKTRQNNNNINFIKRKKLQVKDEIIRLEKEISND